MASFRHSTDIQTLLFDRDVFSAALAKAWAKGHGFRYGKVESTDNFHRFRQHDPSLYRPSTFRTIELTEGVKAVVGVPLGKERKARKAKGSGYDARGPRSNPGEPVKFVPFKEGTLFRMEASQRPSDGWQIDGNRVVFWASKGSAEAAARALGWRAKDVAKVQTRFMYGWAIVDGRYGFLSLDYFRWRVEQMPENSRPPLGNLRSRMEREAIERGSTNPRSNPFHRYRGIPYYATAGVYRVTLPDGEHRSFGQKQGGKRALEAFIDAYAARRARVANPRPLQGSEHPTRSAQVTRYLAQEGLPGYELVKGAGYFYFSGGGELGNVASWGESSVYTYRVGDYTLAEWLHEMRRLAATRRNPLGCIPCRKRNPDFEVHQSGPSTVCIRTWRPVADAETVADAMQIASARAETALAESLGGVRVQRKRKPNPKPIDYPIGARVRTADGRSGRVRAHRTGGMLDIDIGGGIVVRKPSSHVTLLHMQTRSRK